MSGDPEQVIQRCVAEIWSQYDKDNSNTLDKTETKAFVQATMAEMSENDTFSEEDFEGCFKEFDTDGNGTISREEMANFIKKVAGL